MPLVVLARASEPVSFLRGVRCMGEASFCSAARARFAALGYPKARSFESRDDFVEGDGTSEELDTRLLLRLIKPDSGHAGC
ncbi:MAG: hypothetical protein ACSLFM_13740 [Tepidiformaceae bacterium]